MPRLDPLGPTTGPRVTLHGSAAVELFWVLGAGERDDFRRDHPELDDLYRSAPTLAAAVADFWADDASPLAGFMELLLLAHHAGVLLASDLDELFDGFDAVVAAAPTDLPLRSESAGDRRVVLGRVQRLRRSARLRHDYVALLRAVWAAAEPVWQRDGRPAVEAACALRRDQLARGTHWTELVHTECQAFDTVAPGLVADLGPDGTLLVVPAFFAHEALALDLPGTFVVGVRAEGSGRNARARTEGLARRLRSVADPTRLALVVALLDRPQTVGELAAAFELAQPTVSNHVKLLRQAGLVVDERRTHRRLLTVDRDAVDGLLDHLAAALDRDGRPAAPTSADRPAVASA